MSRIARRFAELRSSGRKALIPYVTAGDPRPDFTVALMHEMVVAGADLIEVGIPFSDPMADGPVIQAACERALHAGVNLPQVLSMVARFRQRDTQTPVILMGYLNPIEIMGYRAFAEQARDAGADGVLIVDLPPEEAGPLREVVHDCGMDEVFLVAPTSDASRMAKISRAARGFVYYVSLKGVTGAATPDVAGVAHQVAQIRQVTDLPIGIGFGIKDAETARAFGRLADAVVVGSAVVRLIAEHVQQPDQASDRVVALLRQMRTALDQL